MKKYLLSLMALVLSLTLSQSASAYYGFADTKDYAIPRFYGQDYVGHLDRPDDVDWLKYTNTFSFATTVNLFVMPLGHNSNNVNYDLTMEYCNTNNYCMGTSAGDTGPGNVETLSSIYLPPGYTIYWKVSGHTSSDYGTDYATAVHQ